MSQVRRAVPADSEAWVDTQLASMRAAYAELMPAQFHTDLRARRAELVERRRLDLAEPDFTHRQWLAENDTGVVGIAESRRGATGWEVDRGFPPAVPSRQLTKLYAVPAAHGSGIGQALLDAVLGDEPAYLWLMAGNHRAEAFYRRNRFVPDGLETVAGPTWYGRPMLRLHRLSSGPPPGPAPADPAR